MSMHPTLNNGKITDMKMNERIRSRRKQLKLTQAALANLAGVNRVTVTGWEAADYEPGGANLQALAIALKCNPSWLLHGTGEIDDDELSTSSPRSYGIKAIPLISWVQAGEWTDTVNSVMTTSTQETLYTTATVSDSAFALSVRGDSMTNPDGAPSIPEGAIVVVDPNVVCSSELNGKIVVARIDGSSEATIKKYVVDGPLQYLVPLNPKYKVLEVTGSCRLVGVVRQVIMDL